MGLRSMLGFLNNIGPTEWIIIGLIVVILFGGAIARKLGKASGETYKEIKNIKKSFKEAVSDDSEKSA